MLPIKGIQKVSLVDYSPYTVSAVFLADCNYRCGYCQNADLIVKKDLPIIPETEVISFLKSRLKWIDGVCITGGEPCLHKQLPSFIKKIKELGLLIKLDTNGSNPLMLKELIDNKLLDYIAMDIKGSIDRYEEVTKAKVNIDDIIKSIALIKNSGIDYEFRSTVLPKHHNKEDILKIGKLLGKAKKFSIQQFRNTFALLDESYRKESPFSKQDLEEFKKILLPYFDEVEIKL